MTTHDNAGTEASQPRLYDQTPSDFDGTFYSPDSGSDLIFAMRADFVNEIAEHREGFFLTVGAIADVRMYGDDVLADELLDRARQIWTEHNLWDRYVEYVADFNRRRAAAEEGWQHYIYQLAERMFMPGSQEMPDTFQPTFLSRDIYRITFSARGGTIAVMRRSQYPFAAGILLWADLWINAETALFTEVYEAMKEVWSDRPELVEQVESLHQILAEMAELPRDNRAAALVPFLGAYIEQLTPPAVVVKSYVIADIPVLPQGFTAHILSRELCEMVLDEGAEMMIGVMREGDLPAHAAIHLWAEFVLNNMHELAAQLEQAITTVWADTPTVAKRMQQIKAGLAELGADIENAIALVRKVTEA